MNYFELFNLNQEFDIDLKILSRNFHKLQKKYHPDLNQRYKSEYFKNNNQSILINKGYNVLKNALKRGKYLLKLNGLEIDNKNYHLFLKQKFLEKQLKLNEDLEKLNSCLSKKQDFYKFLNKVCKKKDIYMNEMKNAFSNKKWNIARISLVKLYFLEKVYVKIIDKLNKF